ncbi:MAG: OmpH family outer membrane protein, partial [Bacteroidetes bacterium]
MKKILLLVVAIFFVCQTNAQTLKISYFDINYVLPLLPKFKKAEEDMKVYTKQIKDEAESKQKEFETKYKDYQEKAKTWDPAILKVKQEELQSLEKQINEFEQKAQEDVQAKQGELLSPIYEEIEKTVKEVAIAGGYTHIFRSETAAYGVKTA